MLQAIPLLLLGLVVTACSTTTIKTTDQTPAIQEPEQIPEDQLLDVGVGIFNPGVDAISKEEEGVFPQVREAEARYMPFKLTETLQKTGNWGVVRVIPDRQSEMDLWVDGEILKSDGETLELKIKVEDASGKVWYTKNYKEVASKYAYDDLRNARQDPFQGLYNRIANDMIRFRRQLNPSDITNIQTITKLKFAQRFAPEAYSDYLQQDGRGHYKVKRLPADNDPIMQRVMRIRERDYMFVDTLQDYYGAFARQMAGPYRSWRKESYQETVDLRELKQQSRNRIAGGVLAIVAGILGAASDNAVASTAGVVGIGAGTYMIKSGLDKKEESKIHIEALKELGSSLNAEVQPHTITLEDRTVTLSGTVDDQYAQWRQILKDIYRTETGQTGPVTN
ncbi:MAG: hypothetical protein ACE5GZ_08220 [Gammaproteobacteria bacterium]